jgi:hypothetical protein
MELILKQLPKNPCQEKVLMPAEFKKGIIRYGRAVGKPNPNHKRDNGDGRPVLY